LKLIYHIKHFIKKILGKDFGWSGNYRTWEEAVQHCEGYNAASILEKVKAATLRVKNGDAVYERDSVLFDEIQYSYPLLNSLQFFSEESNNRLSVLDFGGSLGSSYFQNKIVFSKLKELRWSVVEQPNFVDTGTDLIADNHLSFFYTIEEAEQKRGHHDILLLSCVLPYLENPYQFLEHIQSFNFKYIIIDNTYFNIRAKDRLTIQKVHPGIYTATYPAWFLDYEKVVSCFKKNYTVTKEYSNELWLYLDGHKIQYKGIVLKHNSAANKMEQNA